MEESTTDSKYQRFLKWFTQNGGKYSDITYPAYFPPTNYIGISAKNPIPRHKVIIAIPKQLTIGVERVRQSQIGKLLPKYECFNGQDNDDKDFNILTLYLIFEKMKGKDSFFYPYFQCITIAETMVHWSDQQINALDQPYINLAFVKEVRKQFEPTFLIFKQIVDNNQNLFREKLTSQIYYYCYGMVMTRCFGWGLPQTMLVPLADFMNHSADGVHHYTFSSSLQQEDHPHYVKKMRHLNLNTLDIDNTSKLPVGFQKDTREEYLQKNQDLLKSIGLPLTQDVQKLSQAEFRQRFKTLEAIKARETYQNDLLLSSESEDNDSESESDDQQQLETHGPEAIRYLKIKRFFKKLYEIIDKNKDPIFEAPKPEINRQFDQGVNFTWWYQKQDSCFIVASSRSIDEGEQIFNSYGRRSNRFLLLWYGFTYQKNKYDSIPFRLWGENVEQKTGQTVFTRYLTEIDWSQQIPIGDDRFPLTHLSNQFRLKITQFDYHLLAYLRYKIIKSKEKYSLLRTKYGELSRILSLTLEAQVLQLYKNILGDLVKRYKLTEQRNLNIMKRWRAVFSEILIHSDSQIVIRHCFCVQQMIKIIKILKSEQKPKISTLLSMYRSKWNAEQQKSSKILVQNRIFVRHYFRLLHEYISFH